MGEHFVLIRGAWHTGWCWEGVIAALEKAGLTAEAPTMPGMAPGEDRGAVTFDDCVAAITGVLERQSAPVVLVGPSSAGFLLQAAAVLSDLRVAPEAVDFSSLAVSMTRNGEPFITGTTRAVMAGNPADSVAWLASRLSEGGALLSADMVVLTRAMAPAETVSPGDAFEADFGVLGRQRVGSRSRSRHRRIDSSTGLHM